MIKKRLWNVSHDFLTIFCITGTCNTCMGGFKLYLSQCSCASISRTLSAAPSDVFRRKTEDTCQITAVLGDIFTLHSRDCVCTLSIWLWVIVMWQCIYNVFVFFCENLLLLKVSSAYDCHLLVFRPHTPALSHDPFCEYLCPIYL